MTFEVSPSRFAQILGFEYPENKPKLANWIDGLSENECTRGVGAIGKHLRDFLPTDFKAPRDTVFYSLNAIQAEARSFSRDFSLILPIYLWLVGQKSSGESLYRAETLEHLKQSSENFSKFSRAISVLNVIGDPHKVDIVSLLERRLDELSSDAIIQADLSTIERYLREIKASRRRGTTTSFCDSMFERLLSARIYPPSKFTVHSVELEEVQKLSRAILRDNSSEIESSLLRLRTLNAQRLESQRDQPIWGEPRLQVDPSWWREQE